LGEKSGAVPGSDGRVVEVVEDVPVGASEGGVGVFPDDPDVVVLVCCY